ncbi:DUF4149 domain-containing protein [Ramlibacter sp. USB13]|uniref:DUF4149 domain-containing protein n=1 Tax=Ramlibacter cellulosilyticus TaxID=2764187 RepID=A0A923MPY7_9BURK|nr:DUF4149 domain-containing protein [Ramlibacter cellulosilyticus]MBC5783335.1 DUF4149 domain-containing protein [Ramlibacter cellulosilyticus]
MDWKQRLAVLAAALWWGSLCAIGFLAVPLLFANASSPAVAGSLAGKLFSAESWVGLGCGLVLLMGARQRDGTATMDWASGAVVYVLLGMLAALLQEFAIAPHILARQDLRFWHTAGTAAFAVQWLCALVVLWKLSRPGSS